MSFISIKSVITIQLLMLLVIPSLISTADPLVEPCQLLNDGTILQQADSELFTITLSVGCYNPAELVTVNLTSAVNATFDAFTMTAAPTNNNNNRMIGYGTFSSSDSNLHPTNCSGFENDTIASVDRFTNANHSTFNWKADSINNVTAVTFRAAVIMRNVSYLVNKTLPRCSQTTDVPTLLTTAVIADVATGANTNNSAFVVSIATIPSTPQPSYPTSSSSPMPVETSSISSVSASISTSTAAAGIAQSPSSSTLQPVALASSTLAAASSSNPSSPTIQAAAGSQSPSTVTIRLPDVSTATKSTTAVVDGKSTVTTTSSPLATISSVARVTLPPTTTAPRVVPEVTSSKVFTRSGNYSEPIGNATAAVQTTVASAPVISGGISARQRFKLHEFHALIFVCCFILSSV